MDTDIYALVAKYGYKNLHVRLEELMREEHAYFCLKFQATPVPLNRSVLPLQEKLVQEIPLPKKKERKLRVKKPVQTSEVQSEDVQLSLENEGCDCNRF